MYRFRSKPALVSVVLADFSGPPGMKEASKLSQTHRLSGFGGRESI